MRFTKKRLWSLGIFAAFVATMFVTGGSTASATSTAPLITGQWVIDGTAAAAALDQVLGGSTNGFYTPCTIEDPTACLPPEPEPDPEPDPEPEPVGPPSPPPPPPPPPPAPTPPAPTPTPGPTPVQISCDIFQPFYVIFEDNNGNRMYDLADTPLVRWENRVEWCYVIEGSATEFPVLFHKVTPLEPLLNARKRVTSSTTTPSVRIEREFRGNTEFVDSFISNKNFTITITGSGPIETQTIEFNPVIKIMVNGFGGRQACELQENRCTSIF